MDKESRNKSEAVCPSKLELAEVRDKLARTKSGPQYWRSLEELSQTEGFFEMVHREFPRQASVWPEGASRRDFMKLMTASMALAGLSACVKQPIEPIVPYVRQPEPITLGIPLFFASAMPFARVRDAGAGGEPRGTPDQGGRQSGPSGELGWQRCVRAGIDSRHVRSGPVAGGFVHRRHSGVERLYRRPSRDRLNSQKAMQGAGFAY